MLYVSDVKSALLVKQNAGTCCSITQSMKNRERQSWFINFFYSRDTRLSKPDSNDTDRLQFFIVTHLFSFQTTLFLNEVVTLLFSQGLTVGSKLIAYLFSEVLRFLPITTSQMVDSMSTAANLIAISHVCKKGY